MSMITDIYDKGVISTPPARVPCCGAELGGAKTARVREVSKP